MHIANHVQLSFKRESIWQQPMKKEAWTKSQQSQRMTKSSNRAIDPHCVALNRNQIICILFAPRPDSVGYTIHCVRHHHLTTSLTPRCTVCTMEFLAIHFVIDLLSCLSLHLFVIIYAIFSLHYVCEFTKKKTQSQNWYILTISDENDHSVDGRKGNIVKRARSNEANEMESTHTPWRKRRPGIVLEHNTR